MGTTEPDEMSRRAGMKETGQLISSGTATEFPDCSNNFPMQIQ